jgi:predicted glycoside hydrolase/deacetylase ChbG (UPF0249 family)
MFHNGATPRAVSHAKAINDEQRRGSQCCNNRKIPGLRQTFSFYLVWHGTRATIAPQMIFCADDYGMAADIDDAILELASVGRLSAASCMVALKRCTPSQLAPLLALGDRVDIGLHLCFADETLSDFDLKQISRLPTFGEFFRSALFRRITSEQIHGRIAEQYELFVSKAGRAPDYLDGHLHAHQLPVVQDDVISFLKTLPAGSRPYVRNTRMSLGKLRAKGAPILKAAFIGWFGAEFAQRAHEAGLPTNGDFAGIYDFRRAAEFPNYFEAFRESLDTENGILVLHPGKREEWRRMEFETLKSAILPIPPNRFRRSAQNPQSRA